MRHELHPKRIGAAGTWKLFQRLLQRPTTGIGQKLREAELRYDALFNHSTDGVFILSLDGVYLEVSPRGAKMFGYESHELIGRPITATVDPSEQSSAEDKLSTLLEGKAIPLYERTFRAKDGTQVPVEIDLTLVRDSNGKPAYIQSVVRDISHRKRLEEKSRRTTRALGTLSQGHQIPLRAEDELAEREETHRSILERASDGVAIIQDMTIRYANPRLAEIWGVLVSEVIGTSIADHLQQDELDRLADRYKRRLAGENVPALYETSLQRRDGSDVFVEVSAGLIAYEGRPADLILVRDITERKRTEEAVRRSEERYRRIVETAQEGIWVTDAENRTTLVNKKMADMLGCTVDEMVGVSAFTFIAKEDRAKAAGHIERRRQGVSEQLDFRFLRKDGTDLWTLLKSSPIQDEDGNYAGVLRMITDITERKRAEETLRESERRYAALFEHPNDGVFIFSPDGVELAVNERGAEMLGYEVHELVGKPLVYDPAEYADVLRKRAEVFAGRTIPPYERTFRAKDGSPVLVEVNLTVVRDAEKRPLYLQSIVRDIRERKRTEERLRESEERFRRIFEEGPLGVVTSDASFRFTRANSAFCSMLGYTEEELTSLTFQEITHPADVGTNTEQVRRLFRGEIPLYRTEKRYIRKDKAPLWGAVTVTVVRDSEGKFLYFLAMIEDITSRRDAEETVRSLARFPEEDPSPVLRVAADGRILYANRSSTRLLEAWKGGVGKAIPERYRNCVREALLGGILTDEGEIAGRVLFLTFAAIPAEGYVNVYGLDITKLRETEKALAESEAEHRELVENASDLIYTHDLRGKITSLNSTAQLVTGYSLEELMGKDIDLIVAPEYRKHARAMTAAKLRSEGSTVYEVGIVAKDGHQTPVEVSSRLIYKGGKPVGVQGIARDITERREASDRLRKSLDGTIKAVARTTEMRDPYTAGHQERVSRLGCAIAKRMGLSAETVEGLRVAGLLHDVGKVSVPAEILSKPTTLTSIEFSLVKAHAQTGHDILAGIDFPWPVAEIVLQHHERLDGSGYPRVLKGEAVSLEARIIAVADVVEAMASHRPYRPAHGLDQALAELETGAGVLYDFEVVKACLALFQQGYELSRPLPEDKQV